MLVPRSPTAAYRQIELDARVAGSDSPGLVLICYEQFGAALGLAIQADRKQDNLGKSGALTRALSALTVLQLGLDQHSPIAAALSAVFEDARRSILDSAALFDAERIARVRSDFAEIETLLRSG